MYIYHSVWYLKITQMNLSMEHKQNHRHREWTGGEGVGGGMQWEVGISTCKF